MSLLFDFESLHLNVTMQSSGGVPAAAKMFDQYQIICCNARVVENKCMPFPRYTRTSTSFETTILLLKRIYNVYKMHRKRHNQNEEYHKL